ncbi:AAA family ATPase [Yersinia aleksiciae]|uniref:AAA family ATPase n=1 Tax=Yersinia aleksiciae TaxID=263819 RepID=UPI0025AB136B|nr:AAA family ATPase [Yersinia aleksiciae]MDN0122387.1 AAA family ATPase [Yersinia aleksiciae]
MSNGLATFNNLDEVAAHLREKLEEKKYILLFAYNGTGKTRLSMAFKEQSKIDDERDTLYFNAFTEDLFFWDNDLESDARRVLCLNRNSRFFGGLQELEMESRIRPLLARYVDFNFLIDYADWEIIFFREIDKEESPIPIKVSRGEENIFVWCFYLAVAQLAIDEQEAYNWVKYLYIDDPISSLDDNNGIAVASHLAQLVKTANGKLKTVISSHHALFYNVMWNELNEKRKDLQPYFLSTDKAQGTYTLRYTKDTPFFHHVAILKQLHEAVDTNQLYTYHFNILRSILEKTASFHGFPNFSYCIKQDANDEDGVLLARLINVLSHGNYSLFEPREMLEENKQYFKKILNDFMVNYRFNPELFPETTEEIIA